MNNILLFLIILLVPIIFTIVVHVFYKKNLNIVSKSNLTGFEVVRKILDSNGLNDLYIVEFKSYLGDHYDTNQKVVRLSSNVFHGTSLSSIAIASMVAYHAIQDKDNNSLLKFKSSILNFMQFLTYVSYVMYLIGILIMGNFYLYACAMLLACILFYIGTLPIEIEAKEKSFEEIKKFNLIPMDELEEIQKINNMFIFIPLTQIFTCLFKLKEFIKKK